MITVYHFFPAWDLPCISPFATKLVFYLKLAGLPFEIKAHDLSRFDTEAVGAR